MDKCNLHCYDGMSILICAEYVSKETLLDMLNERGAMDRILLNEFVDYVEKQTMLSNEQKYVQDNKGIYQKELYVYF